MAPSFSDALWQIAEDPSDGFSWAKAAGQGWGSVLASPYMSYAVDELNRAGTQGFEALSSPKGRIAGNLLASIAGGIGTGGIGATAAPIVYDSLLSLADQQWGGGQNPFPSRAEDSGQKLLPSRADGLGPAPAEASVQPERRGREFFGDTNVPMRKDAYIVGPDDTFSPSRGNFSKMKTTGLAEKQYFEKSKRDLMEKLAAAALSKPNEYTADILDRLDKIAGGIAGVGNSWSGDAENAAETRASNEEADSAGESWLPNALMAALAAKGVAKGASYIPGPIGKAGKFADELLSINGAKKLLGKGKAAVAAEEAAVEKGGVNILKKAAGSKGGKFGRGVKSNVPVVTGDKGKVVDVAGQVKKDFKDRIKSKAAKRAAQEAEDAAMDANKLKISSEKVPALAKSRDVATRGSREVARTGSKADNVRKQIGIKRSEVPAELGKEGVSRPGSSKRSPTRREILQEREGIKKFREAVTPRKRLELDTFNVGRGAQFKRQGAVDPMAELEGRSAEEVKALLMNYLKKQGLGF